MNRRGPWRPVAVASLALLVAALSVPATAALPAGAPFAPATAAAASTGLTMTADARYTVDPAKRRVHVAVGLSVTNHRTDTKTRRFFFDKAYLAVQPGTTGYRVSSAGVTPRVSVQKRTTTYTLLRIDFGKQLGAGASRAFLLTFDMIDPGGAPTRATRIGTTLVSFGAWGFGSSGTPGGSVTVVFPAGFNVDVDAPLLNKPTTDAAGTITYTSGPLASPLTFFAFFIADRPGAYQETTLQIPIDGRTVPVTLRAWPDDPAWARRVGGLLTRGLPALAKDIGLPWPVDRPLVVSEALSRNTTGFAGRYNPPAGEIDIAYYATPFVVLHEAAHAWFDGRLLADRWASEGFASYYAIRAAKAIGEKNVTGDVLTPALAAARVPLNAWSAPGVDPALVEDAEYAAALRVATLIGQRAGPAGLASVWQAIQARWATYQPDGPRASLETTDAAPDWRGLLDLLDERTAATYDDLWTAWVLRPADQALLADRAGVRARYAAVVRHAGDWQLPRIVRDALRAWQFDQARELLDGADTALAARDCVLAATAGASLTVPSGMQTAFEGPRGFSAASAEANAELAAIDAYRRAEAARPEQADLATTIGLWNSDPSRVLGDAVTAFAAGDLPASIQASSYARTMWTTAADVGRNRALAAGAILAAMLIGGWLVFRWWRDRVVRRRTIVVGEG